MDGHPPPLHEQAPSPAMIHPRFFTRFGLATLALVLASSPASAQIFVVNTADIPNLAGNKFAENVDFGDVDLDGDFDAAFAMGGDNGNIQDRLWINQGGAQAGTLGVFSDVTASQFPAIVKDGRDIELVDFDNDQDLDVYISNTSTNSNQTNLWWVNTGGLQAGTVGFYVDETSTRWSGLGQAGSSIPPSHLIGGGFIDWSCDCDFGDLDNDGDMDLVHSSYGGSFGGQVPTRVFLNDGLGVFSEFNPGGTQLPGSTIGTGDDGLWCEGTFLSNTTDTTGTSCDIATNTLDIDLGDIDGDFDLDLLHGDRDAPTRFFYNRLEENGGAPGDLDFRDMTSFVYGLFAGGDWAPGTGHYEQELGDMDGDCDLDLYGLNWEATGFTFTDLVAENVGGRFDNEAFLAESDTDDNEGDFGDWDCDGDLDLYVGNFSGSDRLYTNDGTGSYSYENQTTSGLDASGASNITLDIDWCDVDADGDYDVFAARDISQDPIFWENTNDVPDTTAPKISPVEALGNFTATITTSPDRAVRAHVYDNAAYYITWYNPTSVNVYRNGVLAEVVAARSSGGQVFRAEISSNLVGNIDYEFVSEDQYGNQSVSALQSYVADPGALTVDSVYGNNTLGDIASEITIDSASILTPGKTWHIEADVTFQWAFFLTICFDPANFLDPCLGWVNVDGFTKIINYIRLTGPIGKRITTVFVPDNITGLTSVHAQLFAPDQAINCWSSSKGLEVFFHE